MEPGESAEHQSRRQRAKAEGLRAQGQELLTRADRVHQSAEMWSRGHAGEQTVGAELELLRTQGFEVLHDLHWPGRSRANIDHVAIGPPGILVVDAKNWSGAVTVQDGVLRQNGHPRHREVDGAGRAAADVGGLLRPPLAGHVFPVIALAGADAGDVQQCGNVTVIGHRDLVAWATGLPSRLTVADVLDVASTLRAAMPPASVPTPRAGGQVPGPATPPTPSVPARKKNAGRQAARRTLLLRLLGVLLIATLAPVALAWWGSHGEDLVRVAIPTPTITVPSPTPGPTFAGCPALRLSFPSGVRRPGAVNIGRKVRAAPASNDAVYRANARLDHDEDGLVCEVTRPKKHKGG